MKYSIALLCLFLIDIIVGLHPTDSTTSSGDNTRSGYQPNHNMDPGVVGSDQFGNIWTTQLPGNKEGHLERIYAQPLVYTPSDTQYLYVATGQNNIYKLNAKNGDIVEKRNLHIPFLASDLDGCVDIFPFVGVTSTGVIDPETNTWYLTSKTYVNQTEGISGKPNGRYWIHAVSTIDLSEKENFPINLEGIIARNNPNRMFQGGIHLQRPALVLSSSGFIYGGFGSHCVQYNFTGWIFGWDSNGNIVERFATQGGSEPNTVKGGGIWMAGGGIASEGRDLYFSTGNGYASQLHGVPVPGRSPPTSLEEAVVHMAINANGSITPVDFFIPWEKEALDGADKDVGSCPFALLPKEFGCPNSPRLGVQPTKSGKVYFLNLDDLGGYCNGIDRQDRIPQSFQTENAMWSGAGVYPLEGGYVYASPIGFPINVFKASCDDNGNALFTLVAKSLESQAKILGAGHGTTTSLNGIPGTGLVWITDVRAPNLRIYNAVPKDGVLNLLRSFSVGSNEAPVKFSRPVFGNGMAYTVKTGFIYAFGSPTNIPLTCYVENFGSGLLFPFNTSNPIKTVSCQAKFDLIVTNVSHVLRHFNVLSTLALPYPLSKGANITFEVQFEPKEPGNVAENIVVISEHSKGEYSKQATITLQGEGESIDPLLSASPNTITFRSFLFGENVPSEDLSLILSNLGGTSLNITSWDFSFISEGGATVTPNGTTVGAFKFSQLPTTIASKSQEIIRISFKPPSTGKFQIYLTIKSTGGDTIIDIFATSNTLPVALVEFQTPDGKDWVKYVPGVPFSFGNVLEKQTKNLLLRLTNSGGPDAEALVVTVSKPPIGGDIIGVVNSIDLGEGTILSVGQSLTAALYCAPHYKQVNNPSFEVRAVWTMNNGDPSFGHQVMSFVCNATTEQYGPLLSNDEALYKYEGCFKENNPGRQLESHLYTGDDTNNSKCIWSCYNAGYKYAGTQYHSECWCGNTKPVLMSEDGNCNFICSGGNGNEICGGNGIFHDSSWISLFTRQTGLLATTLPPNSEIPRPSIPSFTNSSVQIISGDWNYVGCLNNKEKIIQGTKWLSDPMSVGKCAAHCIETREGPIAAVEYGSECWCGKIKVEPSLSFNCDIPCPGDSNQICGGPNSISAFNLTSWVEINFNPNLPSWTYAGCYKEGTERVLPRLGYNSDDSSPSKCTASCTSLGYNVSGLEFGRECYCGTSTDLKSATPSLDPANTCNVRCSGDSASICGGSGYLSVYSYINPKLGQLSVASTLHFFIGLQAIAAVLVFVL